MPHIAFKDYLHESQLFLARGILAGLFVILTLLVLIVRLIMLQVASHEHFTTLSQDNSVKLEPLPPTRGLIYDANGVLLAENFPAYTLEIVPEKVQDVSEIIAQLGRIITIDEADIRRFEHMRKQRRRFDGVPLRVKLTEEEVAQFAVNRHRFPGARIRANLLRYYPLGEQTAHVLGYVSRINEEELKRIDVSNYSGTSHIGKIGVEKASEDLLHGKVGLQQVEVNATGRVLRVLEDRQSQPGSDLYLFLDVQLQAEAALALEDYNGAVVAIDPSTGGILALVSKPSYDPNLFVEGISPTDYKALRNSEDKPLFNRALRGQYPPGSTIKPFVALGGLETGTIGYTETKYCPGFYQLPGHRHKYRDWRKWGHGVVDMDVAITQSCDVYFYDLAHSLGINQLHGFLSGFSFGRKTGADLTGELGGLLPSRAWKRRARNQPWFPGETLIVGIGQGAFLATPLQLAAATATVASRGTFIRPRVVRAVQASSGSGDLIHVPPDITNLPIRKKHHWDRVIESMLHVVEGKRGTARRIRTDAYRIAGKTGTAQVFTVKQNEEYKEHQVAEKMRDHALFVAFAPVDKPRIAVAVVVENGGHGGAVAAPIARRVMDQYLLRGVQ